MKIELDKYYTEKSIALKCIQYFKDNLDFVPSEWLDPCAGDGAFSSLIPNCIAFDIEPDSNSIMRLDFLKECSLEYKERRVIVTNPPFGDRLNTARKFLHKSLEISDLVGFILPISQFGKAYYFKAELVKSYDLGLEKYSGRPLHCCFNIYRKKDIESTMVSNKTPIVIIKRDGDKNFETFDFDFAIYRRGSPGKERKSNLHTQTYKIKVLDGYDCNKIKEDIIRNNWINHISSPWIAKIDILNFLNKNISKYETNKTIV
jgi:hypothetical protein